MLSSGIIGLCVNYSMVGARVVLADPTPTRYDGLAHGAEGQLGEITAQAIPSRVGHRRSAFCWFATFIRSSTLDGLGSLGSGLIRRFG